MRSWLRAPTWIMTTTCSLRWGNISRAERRGVGVGMLRPHARRCSSAKHRHVLRCCDPNAVTSSATKIGAAQCMAACGLPVRDCASRASAPGTSGHGNQEQNAYRCHPRRGDSGGGAPQRPGRGVRLRIGRPQASARQHLSGEGDARRAVAAGGLRGLRRQPPRLPRLQRDPSRLLSDPGRRPAGPAAGGGRGRSRSRG